MFDFAYARHRMIERQLRARGVHDERVLTAMGEVAREEFTALRLKEAAYEDAPLSIDEGQTISQPYIVGLMIEKAAIGPDDAVLEIGTGSGYAAAVLSRIAAHVYTIERLPSLAAEAGRRLRRLGYANVVSRVGDGTKGWPDPAPFDAIIVAAGGPEVPLALKEQLEIGGRLIIPVGTENDQRLMRITRTGSATFEEEDLGGVRFVPLVGEGGWGAGSSGPATPTPPLTAVIASRGEVFAGTDHDNFGALFDRFGTRRVVLLGEASHGTSEFYRARAAITRRLVERHGFTIVAVEADWPDAAQVDRHIRGRESQASQHPFQRFPTWMWRNAEVGGLIGWMRQHNLSVDDPAKMVGFYGLDIYNMSGSIAAVLAYLKDNDPEAFKLARERYGCLAPWQDEPEAYGRAALTGGYGNCEKAVVAQCRDLLQRHLNGLLGDDRDLLDAKHNARLVAAAEHYYRIMYYGGAEAWNLRDTHMFETLDHLLAAGGPDAKAVVWAHNSHVGDARHTDMGTLHDELNLGQLCRERYGEEVATIGFGTYSGKVAAASDWDAPMEIKTIRPALDGSYEALFHQVGQAQFLLDFSQHEDLRERLAEPRLERFIGVIYRPESERFSHYMHASLPRQFDAFVWFDQTSPVTALAAPEGKAGTPDTYPFGT